MAHIQHLFEDRDITLGDIISITSLAASGELNDVTEKFDGQSIVFSCTSKYEALFARNLNDIKNGGMSAAVLENKYLGRGLVQETFVEASSALRMAVRTFTPRELSSTFDDGKIWYSAEIIFAKNPNVIAYEQNVIVLHERPIFRRTTNDVIDVHDAKFISISHIDNINESLKQLDWSVRGPCRISLSQKTSSLQELHDLVAKMGSTGLTLQKFLTLRAQEELRSHGMGTMLLEEAALRLSEASNAPSITHLRVRVPTQVLNLLRKSDEWVAKQLRPLEIAITNFAIDLLVDVKSSLVTDSILEAERIRSNLAEALLLIQSSRNQYAIDYIKPHMEKLKDVRRVHALEGVVFPWKNGQKLYKLTGAFAPTNAILGVCRYGRGKNIPPICP